MAQMWAGLDTTATCTIDDTHDHFTVIEGLSGPASPITRALCGPAQGQADAAEFDASQIRQETEGDRGTLGMVLEPVAPGRPHRP